MLGTYRLGQRIFRFHCQPPLPIICRGEDMTCILLARNIASCMQCGAAGGATALLQLAHAAHLNTARTLEWRQRPLREML